jgi:hypothetical protein
MMPMGDPLGPGYAGDTSSFVHRDWDQVGRCDDRELCNGITGVQYLVCKVGLNTTAESK